jgi:hypothetical protein
MASWILIAAAKSLFAAFDELAPDRDHASDGSIGDAAHQNEVSDHNPDETGSVPIHDADHINEVHAIDVDSDLRTPGLTMEAVVQFVLARCRKGAEKRLRYIIYNRRIWEADNSWKLRTYTGDSAHTEHAHFSFSYTTSLEASTVSWHLEDIPVALTSADKTWIQQQIAAVTAFDTPQSDGTASSKMCRLVLTQGIPNGTRDGEPRDAAWQVIADLGRALVELQAKVDGLSARLGDPAAPASLPQPR